MKYLNVEMKKMFKSNLFWSGFGIAAIFILSIIIGYCIKSISDISVFDIALVSLGNMVNSLIYYFCIAIIVSSVFAYEFTSRVQIYIKIKSIKLWDIYKAKFISCYIYSLLLTLFIFMFSFILGLLMADMGPVHGQDMDYVVQNGLLRIALFYVLTCMNSLVFISFVGFLSIKLRSNLSSLIVSMGVFIGLLLFANVLGDLIEWTPIAYYNLKYYIATEQINIRGLIKGEIISCIYASVFITLCYIELHRERLDG